MPVVVSQHSFWYDVQTLTPRDRHLLAWCLDHVSRTVTSGPAVFAKLVEVGAARERLAPVVPFLAPPAEDLERVAWPAAIAALRQHGGPLIASGTGRLDAPGGRDLYGLGVFVRAARRVLQDRPDARFVYLIGALGDMGVWEAAHAYLAEHGLRDRVCILVDDLPGPVLWQAADVYVRATLDDGDAVSVREAMHFGVPTVASDVVGRPPGCHTYRGGDTDDLARTVLALLADPSGSRRSAQDHRPAEGFDALVDVYRDVFGERLWRDRVRRKLRSAVAVARGPLDSHEPHRSRPT